MENKKLTAYEIQCIKNLQTETQKVKDTLGAIAFREIELNDAKQAQTDAYRNLKVEEVRLGKALEHKYGSGNINLDDGTFTPDPVPTKAV
jgi:hypothetical protein|tara:strand:+ start:3586 stop:3855 length:270 start_codon:yes stop_codon:yes gene_type:complete